MSLRLQTCWALSPLLQRVTMRALCQRPEADLFQELVKQVSSDYRCCYKFLGLKCLELFHGILNSKESQTKMKTGDETFEVSFHNEGQEIRFCISFQKE